MRARTAALKGTEVVSSAVNCEERRECVLSDVVVIENGQFVGEFIDIILFQFRGQFSEDTRACQTSTRSECDAQVRARRPPASPNHLLEHVDNQRADVRVIREEYLHELRRGQH